MCCCNKCGQSCESSKYPKDQVDPKNPPLFGLIGAKVRGHFHSDGLVDLTEYTFNLCEKCLAFMFEGFKVPVSTREYLVSEELREPNPVTAAAGRDLMQRAFERLDVLLSMDEKALDALFRTRVPCNAMVTSTYQVDRDSDGTAKLTVLALLNALFSEGDEESRIRALWNEDGTLDRFTMRGEPSRKDFL